MPSLCRTARCFTSFVDKMPLEIILEVFGCLGVYSADDPSTRMLSLACTTFRTAIVNSSTFWREVFVDLDKAPTTDGLKWLHLKIERSQPSSIRCHIVGMQETAIPDPAVDSVLACCERWEELFLSIHPDVLPTVISPVKGRLERLRKLSLSVLDISSGLRTLKIPACFKDAPVLEHIEFLLLPHGDYSVLPLQQIQHCFIEDSWPFSAEDFTPISPILSILLHPESQLRELHINTCRKTGNAPRYVHLTSKY